MQYTYITATVDGVQSAPFPVYIDEPYTTHLTNMGVWCYQGLCNCEGMNGGVWPFGYANYVTYSITDSAGVTTLAPITLNETFEKQQWLNTAYSWLGLPSPTLWHPENWSGNTFKDIWAACASAEYPSSPLYDYGSVPTGPIMNMTQKLWIGPNHFYGVCLQRGVLTYYADQGALTPFYTPVPQQSQCNPGQVLNY